MYLPAGLSQQQRRHGSLLKVDLQSWWTFDQVSGNRTDSHGSQTLTDINTVTSTAGKKSNAAVYTSANNEYLDRTSSLLGGRANNWSMAGWIYATTFPSTYPTIVSNCAGSAINQIDYSLLFNHISNRFEFYVNDSSVNRWATATSFGAPSTATWYWIYCEYAGTSSNNIGISINNGTLNTAIGPTTPNMVNSHFIFGAHWGIGRYWNGRTDEWGWWNRLLTAGERTTLYNGGTGLTYTDL